MRNKRSLFITLIVLGTGLTLTQFQNCAPPAEQSTTFSDAGQVRIVDEFNKADIKFVADSVQLHDEALQADVGGLCSRVRNNNKLKWAVYTDGSDQEPVLIGESVCRMGQFSVLLADLDHMVCGIDHVLVVQGEWGAVAKTNFSRRCQPLASEIVLAPSESPHGTVCSIEFNLNNSGQNSCNQICYRHNKVVRVDQVEGFRCSAIAAKLAGP